MELFLLKQVRDLQFHLFNFMRFWLGHLSTKRFLWMASWCCDVSSNPLIFVLPADLLRIHSAHHPNHVIMYLMKFSRIWTICFGLELQTNIQFLGIYFRIYKRHTKNSIECKENYMSLFNSNTSLILFQKKQGLFFLFKSEVEMMYFHSAMLYSLWSLCLTSE